MIYMHAFSVISCNFTNLLLQVRDELEHLLDDDNDMAEMYLTEKIYAYAADQTSSIEEVYDGEQEVDGERF